MAARVALGRLRGVAAALLWAGVTLLVAVVLAGAAAADPSAADISGADPAPADISGAETGGAESGVAGTIDAAPPGVPEPEGAPTETQAGVTQSAPSPAEPPGAAAGQVTEVPQVPAPLTDADQAPSHGPPPGSDVPLGAWILDLAGETEAAVEPPGATGHEPVSLPGQRGATGAAAVELATAGEPATAGTGTADSPVIDDGESLAGPGAAAGAGGPTTMAAVAFETGSLPLGVTADRRATGPGAAPTAGPPEGAGTNPDAGAGAAGASVLAGLETGTPATPAAVPSGAGALVNAAPHSGGGTFTMVTVLAVLVAAAATLCARILATGSAGGVRSNTVQGAISGAGPPAGGDPHSVPCHRRPDPSRRRSFRPPSSSRCTRPLPAVPAVRASAPAPAEWAGHLLADLIRRPHRRSLGGVNRRPIARRPLTLSMASAAPRRPHAITQAALRRAAPPEEPTTKRSFQDVPTSDQRPARQPEGASVTTTRALPGDGVRRAVYGLLVLAAALAMALAIGSGTASADQEAEVDNEGVAVANTGGNVAVGNASTNEAENEQEAEAESDGDGAAVAVNAGGASNSSDGTASIETGDAEATGVHADTEIDQSSEGGGFINLSDQEAEVDNEGFAAANTGGNVAVGNVSDNEAENDQEAEAESDGDGDAVALNFGGAKNHSDGTASIETGDATAVGVAAHTEIDQEAGGGWWFINLSDQEAEVDNEGFALANSGFNVAVGNASDNEAENDQEAEAESDGDGDAVALNFGGAKNHSDGTASIETGDATAGGVAAATEIDQSSEGGGFINLSDQEAEVDNEGFALANSGFNLAVGNASDNEAENDQEAEAESDGDGDAVAFNFGGASNHSDGKASIDTGDALAIGVAAWTHIEQALED